MNSYLLFIIENICVSSVLGDFEQLSDWKPSKHQPDLATKSESERKNVVDQLQAAVAHASVLQVRVQLKGKLTDCTSRD